MSEWEFDWNGETAMVCGRRIAKCSGCLAREWTEPNAVEAIISSGNQRRFWVVLCAGSMEDKRE